MLKLILIDTLLRKPSFPAFVCVPRKNSHNVDQDLDYESNKRVNWKRSARFGFFQLAGIWCFANFEGSLLKLGIEDPHCLLSISCPEVPTSPLSCSRSPPAFGWVDLCSYLSGRWLTTPRTLKGFRQAVLSFCAKEVFTSKESRKWQETGVNCFEPTQFTNGVQCLKIQKKNINCVQFVPACINESSEYVKKWFTSYQCCVFGF